MMRSSADNMVIISRPRNHVFVHENSVHTRRRQIPILFSNPINIYKKENEIVRAYLDCSVYF